MYNDEDEEISKCCGMLAIAALFTAAILGAPWIIAFWVGSPVTSLFESVTKNATYTCIVNDKLPCGHEPVLSDWFLATLVQVIVASLEYFFNVKAYTGSRCTFLHIFHQSLHESSVVSCSCDAASCKPSFHDHRDSM